MRQGKTASRTLLFSCRQIRWRFRSDGSLLDEACILSVKSAARRPSWRWLKIAFIGFLLLPILASTTGSVGARVLEASKRGGEYQVKIQVDRDPPIIGANNIAVEIKDSSGRVVTDAAVLINYYMPPMPRMIPMFYRTDASAREGKYRATMNFVMSGPWVIAVKVTSGGKTSTAKFNVDAQ